LHGCVWFVCLYPASYLNFSNILTTLTDTPWIEEMTPSPARITDSSSPASNTESAKPTLAGFSPSQTGASPATKQRSTILVHRKSPLLVATPPAVTRALAFSHPFLLPLTQIVGLVTWTSGDPWESFMVVAGFWAITLYSDIAIRYAGPVLLVTAIILGMYSRRYSPLSSSGWTGEKLPDHKKDTSQSNMRHQKSLDEIIETLNTFTSRCNVLLEPFMQLTDFLSTQRTATSATTTPALTSLFIRILVVTPIWIGLTAPPFYIFTTRTVVLAIGTMMLSWHSRPARVSRSLLWRSKVIRRMVSFVTGLDFGQPQRETSKPKPPPLPPRNKSQHDMASSLASRDQAKSLGVRFTFVIFENQRRWLGLGWTYSLLAYERAAWTDEHLNPSDPKDDFQLPEVENGTASWRWVPGSEWQVEGSGKGKARSGADGWIFYDNKVRFSPPGPLKSIITLTFSSGMTAAAAKTAGANTPADENGTETPSSSKAPTTPSPHPPKPSNPNELPLPPPPHHQAPPRPLTKTIMIRAAVRHDGGDSSRGGRARRAVVISRPRRRCGARMTRRC